MSDTDGYKALTVGLLDWFLRLIIGATAVIVLTLWRDVSIIQENSFTAIDGLRMQSQIEKFCRDLVDGHEEGEH